MFLVASDAVPTTVSWIAQMPDPVLVLLCALAACLGAFPLARATGLVGLFSSREQKLTLQLTALAQACAALAGREGKVEGRPPTPVISAFRPLVRMLGNVLERRLPAHETFAAASVEVDEWVAGRMLARSIPLLVCRAGPAIGLGTALGALLMMAEVWGESRHARVRYGLVHRAVGCWVRPLRDSAGRRGWLA